MKQLPNERVVAYFATMEDLLIKLNFPLPAIDKVRLIEKNLLPDYVRSLSLTNYGTVETLKRACKSLEAHFAVAENYSSSRPVEPESLSHIIRYNNSGQPNLGHSRGDSGWNSNRNDTRYPRYQPRNNNYQPRNFYNNQPRDNYYGPSRSYGDNRGGNQSFRPNTMNHPHNPKVLLID